VTLSFLDRYSPHVVAGGLCIGLAAANLVRLGSAWMLATALVAVVGYVALDEGRRRLAALTVALAIAGLWWGSVRLEALDRSVLAPRIGEVGRALVEITGPTRRTSFRLRAPARVQTFRGRGLRGSCRPGAADFDRAPRRRTVGGERAKCDRRALRA
jgi:hypothetical protein